MYIYAYTRAIWAGQVCVYIYTCIYKSYMGRTGLCVYIYMHIQELYGQNRSVCIYIHAYTRAIWEEQVCVYIYIHIHIQELYNSIGVYNFKSYEALTDGGLHGYSLVSSIQTSCDPSPIQ